MWRIALLCAIAAAQQPHRESLRHREKRHARVLRELADRGVEDIAEAWAGLCAAWNRKLRFLSRMIKI